MFQDLRYGARMLWRNPGFTLIAVITLSLGIGANTAIFGIVNAVLLRPLPYLDEQRLIAIESGDRTKGERQMSGLSPGNFWELRTTTQSFEEIAGSIGSAYGFRDRENPETVRGVLATPGFFKAFRVQPLLGRLIAESDTCNKCPEVILLSYRLWQRRFGGDPNIIGRTLPESGAQIIGVLPSDFKYPAHAEVWQPLVDQLQAQDRASRYFQVYGLLKPGVSIEQARAEMQTFAAHVEQTFPKGNKDLGFALTPYRERMGRDVRTSILLLLGAVAGVLLITCANVANLLLSRALVRRKELAIRAALGASSARLLRQWFSEGLLLAGVSALCGWGVALYARAGLLMLLPQSYAYLQLKDHLRFDWRVLVFTVGVTALTALVFSIVPALYASRLAVGGVLKEGQRVTESRQTQRVRNLLVVAEVALAFVLLAGAGLLINSFLRLQRTELGFDPHNIFGLSLSIPMNKSQADKAELIRQFQAAVEALPEVKAAAVTTQGVFPYLSFQLNRVDKPMPADEPVLYDVISPNYFTALGGALMKGRYFTEQDTQMAEPVGLINETLARRFFADEDPLDKTVLFNYLGKQQQRRIVGVVRDMRQGELAKLQPQLFVPFTQQPWLSAGLVVRARTSPDSAWRAARNALMTVDPRQSVSNLQTAEELIGEKLEEPRLYTVLLGICGLLALMLAVAGIFGVMSYNVAQRTPEIGTRMALGARTSDVLKLVLSLGMTLVMSGVGLGLIGSFALTRLMKGLLYGVSATDPLTFLLIASLLTAVALLACYIPARRATKVDPWVALRHE